MSGSGIASCSLWFLTSPPALRDALEATREFAGTQGYYNMSATDHVGLDKRSRHIVRIEGGRAHQHVAERIEPHAQDAPGCAPAGRAAFGPWTGPA